MTLPSETGEVASRCMTSALNDAELDPTKIDYINAHGTSTPAGDILELKAVKKTFNDHSKNLIINSSKSMIGHLLGAAGGVEAIVCILSILNSKVHQTINVSNLDTECDLNVNHQSAVDCDINYALSNSFGFGGTNGSLIFSKFKD
jgi:3-oxoacyl-[acyl-carrier-protein] synthase II